MNGASLLERRMSSTPLPVDSIGFDRDSPKTDKHQLCQQAIKQMSRDRARDSLNHGSSMIRHIKWHIDQNAVHHLPHKRNLFGKSDVVEGIVVVEAVCLVF